MPRHLFNQRHHASRPGHVPPLPHPSWRAEDAVQAQQAHAIDAREFWQRLGL